MVIIVTQCVECSNYIDFETKKPKSIDRFFYQTSLGDFVCVCGAKLDEETAFSKLSDATQHLICKEER